ncbi:MAG: tRNA pseudouridine(13) synthase TruD [Promethearchaeota archaeon]
MSSIENQVGIETYSTQIPGIGGKLRTKVKDFIVEEISPQGTIIKSLIVNQKHPKHNLNFKNLSKNYSTYNLVLEKYNLETFSAIRKIATFLRIPYKNIGYAGLKDKRAITTQQISISRINPQQLSDFKSKRIYLNRIQIGKPIKLGDLIGNHFNIVIRQINESKIQQRINQIKEQILSSYIPNYYGHQRFGVIRPISHKVGRVLLYEDYETALKIYLTASFPQEKKEIQELRTALQDSWPHVEANFPNGYYYEKRIIQSLKENSSNFKKIFKTIFPFRYTLLFIHAYQSYLFNKLLSARLTKAKLPLNQAVEGDHVAILDQFSLPTHAIYEVNSKNLNSINKIISNGKGLLMFPLFGFDLDYSKNPLADIIAQLLEDENLKLILFKSHSNNKLHIKVIYRPISFRPKKLTITINEPSNTSEGIIIRFNFSINKGSYATVLLREFMKTTPLNY